MLITFEGVDTSGKTTQASLLHIMLQSMGIKSHYVKIPGATLASRELFKFINNNKLSKFTEMLTFLTIINDIAINVINKHRSNSVVVCDRYYFSTLAYSAYGYGLHRTEIWRLIDALELPEPDLNVFMRIGLDGEGIRKRIDEYRPEKTKFETESAKFYEQVQYGFGFELPIENTLTIEALNPVMDNFNLIYNAVNDCSLSVLPVRQRPSKAQIEGLIKKLKE